jgi:hypothetical protein
MNDDPQPNALLSGADVSVSQYLVRRERELVQQTAALRGLLGPKEKELADVRQAMQAIGLATSPYAEHVEALKPFLDPQERPDSLSYKGILNADAATLNQWAEGLTIKDMILRALNEHFHLGATPSELRDYMLTAYGRTIDRNSISPQLARLRDEGLVQNTNALSGKWEIVLRGNLQEAAAEVERKNVNALASSPRLPIHRRPTSKDIFE